MKLEKGMWITYEEMVDWAGIGWDESWSEEKKQWAAEESFYRLFAAAGLGEVEGRIGEGLVILEVFTPEYNPTYDLVYRKFNEVWDSSGLDHEDLVTEKFIKKFPDLFSNYTFEEVKEMVLEVLVRKYGKPRNKLF